MDHDMHYIHEVTAIKPATPATPALYKPYVAPVRAETDHLPLLNTDDLPQHIFWEVLGKALTTKRDFESAHESKFTAWLALRLNATMIDAAGNVHVDTRFDTSHRSMFTAHTDTVHSCGGVNKVRVDGKFWRADKGAALGADDGSGCAVLAHMITNGVPGYYVFFRGEERGGVGSKYLADKMPELFKGQFDRAVAFDRAGYYDVITHQAGGRCCSDEFAQALADQISTEESWYLPCNGGVYTDTAEFTELIPECTNISVGYKNQHGDCESQDVEFLWDLAKMVMGVQWDELPTVRDPLAKPKYPKYAKYEAYKSAYGTMDDLDDYWDTFNTKTTDPKDAKNDGVYKGTPLPPIDDENTDRETGLDYDSDEYMLLYALEEFASEDDQTYLLDLMAEAAYPEDPPLALRAINKKLITEQDLDQAAHMLTEGWTAHAVLLELYDCAAS